MTFTAGTEVTEIDGDTVTLKDVYTQELSTLADIDAIVLVLGNTANDSLARELDGSGVEVHVVGDAHAPRRIFNAIWEGEQAARNL